MTSKVTGWDQWLGKLTDKSPDVRGEAADRLVELCRAGAPPFEKIVETLRDRIAMRNPGREKVPEILGRMRLAFKSIAQLRARVEGFLVSRPKTPPPEDEGGLTWYVITKLWDVAHIYEDKITFEESIKGATAGQRAMYAIWFSKSEIDNGGYHQYYSNPTGILALDAAVAFGLIGMTILEKNHRETMKLFPDGEPPTDRALRVRALKSIDPGAFEAFDEVFYGSSDDIITAADAFVLKNAGEFFSNP